MPILSSEKRPLVLVTGANGHAASHIIHVLLEANYRVRGTVRSEAALALVSKPFARFGDALDVVRVPDLTVVRLLSLAN
jgi:nucleoside-diphosphate-sugar epimerase